jgi:hypothetical protein
VTRPGDSTGRHENAWTKLSAAERRAKAPSLYLWTVIASLGVAALMWLVVPWWVAAAASVRSMGFGVGLINHLVRAPRSVSVVSVTKTVILAWAILAVVMVVGFALAASIPGD